MPKVAIMTISARVGSNSKYVASVFQKTIKLLCDKVELLTIDLSQRNIAPYIDQREHPNPNYPQDDFVNLLESIFNADAIIIFTPYYWYSYPAKFQIFLERFSEALRRPELDFRKNMAGKLWSAVVVWGGDCGVYPEAFWQRQENICNYIKARVLPGVCFFADAPFTLEHNFSFEVSQKLEGYAKSVLEKLNCSVVHDLYDNSKV